MSDDEMGEPFSVTAKSTIPSEDLPNDWDELSEDEKREFIVNYEPSE